MRQVRLLKALGTFSVERTKQAPPRPPAPSSALAAVGTWSNAIQCTNFKD